MAESCCNQRWSCDSQMHAAFSCKKVLIQGPYIMTFRALGLTIHDNPVNNTEAWFGITSGFLVNPPTTSTERSRILIRLQSHPYLCHFGAAQAKDLETAAYLDSKTSYLRRTTLQ